MQKCVVIFIIIGISISGFSQLNYKTKETDDGMFTYTYHKNGKLSTEQFYPNRNIYGEQGYAKAFSYNGDVIYEKPTSRTALLSSVTFSYYTNGAIKCAEYNSHPDAGIQWYRSFTYFDEYGIQTGFNELSHDMQVTVFYIPDSSNQYEEKPNKQDLLKQNKYQFEIAEQRKRDSLAFFVIDTIQIGKDTIVMFIPETQNGLIRKQTLIKHKLIMEEIIFFKPINGIVSIERNFYKNGVCSFERIVYANVSTYRRWNKKGVIIEEKF